MPAVLAGISALVSTRQAILSFLPLEKTGIETLLCFCRGSIFLALSVSRSFCW